MRVCLPEQAIANLPVSLDSGGCLVVVNSQHQAQAVQESTLVSLVDKLDLALVMPTSGSTGTPKWALIPRRALEAAATISRARIGVADTWHLALSAGYIAGMMVAVRAHMAGAQLVQAHPDLSCLAPREGVNHISIVPTQLAKALADRDLGTRLARCETILVGGGRIPAELLRRGREAGMNLVTTYGMTETCGGVVYDGIALDQVRVEIIDKLIHIITPTAFAGYLHLESGTVTNQPAYLNDGLGRVETTDLGRIDSGKLTVLGRSDDVIKSGGIKINLTQVQQVADEIAADAGIDPSQVCIVGVEDEYWGNLVGLVTSAVLPKQWWQDAFRCRAASPGFDPRFIPKRVLTGQVLPRLPSGKLDRIKASELLRRDQ